jgi:hypothetical protein
MTSNTEGLREYPLDRAEGLKLEFKRMESLKSPGDIAREVVSMLNEQGGDVWIGFEEDKHGRAIAEQDIPDVDAARGRLEESLAQRIKVDTVREGDWRVEVASRPSGKKCLVVRVGSLGEDRPPAAALDQGPRFFRRSDSRVRPMEWHEIRDRFLGSSVKSTEDGAGQILRDWRGSFEKQGLDLLGIALVPRDPVSFQIASPDLQVLLADPRLAGNRRSGATYGWPNAEPNENESGALSIGPRLQREVRLTQRGLLTFQVRLDWLRADRSTPESRRIDGLSLLEYTVSFLRLAKALFQEKPEADSFLLDFVLTGAKGWSLPQHQPGSMGFRDAARSDSIWPDRRLNDYRIDQPIVITRSYLLANPDRIAFRLLMDFYDWNRLPPDRIPNAYDRATERFTLTD